MVLSFGLLASCQQAPKSVARSTINENVYDVRVRSAVQTSSDVADTLVHRVYLSNADLDKLIQDGSEYLKVPFGGIGEFDLNGRPIGFRLVRHSSGQHQLSLGLKEGDLVTAVGRKHTADLSDLRIVIDQLRARQEASLTVLRSGKPHKIYYFLKQDG